MKKKILTFVLSGFIFITLSVSGQNKDYPIKKLNGIEYYVYTVQTSEGLFAIGRKFEISPAEISKTNPEIEKGLKAGQQLLIPVKTSLSLSKKTNEKTTYISQNKEFIQYTVKKKQTLFSISKKYNLSQEEIIKYNPEIINGLKEGTVLQIPKETKLSKKKIKENELLTQTSNQNSDLENNKLKGIHIVQPQETLYSIARLYNIKVIDLIRLNPGLSTNLSVGSEINIPKSQSSSLNSENNNSNTDPTKFITENKTIKIAFLLPFFLDQDKFDPSTERFLEFYAGSLIAIEDAKKHGISLEIYTFNTEKSEDKITEILSNPELKNMDLIVGPAFSNQVSVVADFAKENKINTLIPFTSKVPDIESNSYLFQFNPGLEAEVKYTLELLKNNYKNANVIFAEIPGVSSNDEGNIKFESLQKELLKERKVFSTLKLTTSDNVDIKSVLSNKVKNILIFNTDKYVTTSPFINIFRTNSTNYDLTLFEPYSWKNQKEKLGKNLYISPFKFEVDSTSLNIFDNQFTQFFFDNTSADSPRFDLLGYDLSNYFISILNRYSDNFNKKIGSYVLSNEIQSLPHFERTSTKSGFINQQLYLGEDNAE